MAFLNSNYTILTLTLESVNNGSDLFNKEEFLNEEMGERRQGTVSVAFLTVVYCAIFITGVIGNLSTCIVIAKNPYLHTATNYYLLSLAVSDMFTLLLGLPPELYSIWEAYPWRFGEAFCIFKSFFSEMTSYASVLTITAFTGERYVAICYPIKSQTFSNLRRAVRIILVIWLVACVCALPFPVHTRLFYYLKYPNSTDPIYESLQCNIPFEWLESMTSMFQISTFVFFVLPMVIITVMYVLIGISLKKSHFHQSPPTSGGKVEAKTAAKTAVIKMLVAVVVGFFVCWAPFHAQRLMTVYIDQDQWTPTLMIIQSHLFYISGVLYFLNATINPILYNLMSRKFRSAFIRTLCRCCFSKEELFELRGTSRSVLYSERVALNGRASVYGREIPIMSMKYTNGCSFRSREDVCLKQSHRSSPRNTLLHVKGLTYSERNLLQIYDRNTKPHSKSLNSSPTHSLNNLRQVSSDCVDSLNSVKYPSSKFSASTHCIMLKGSSNISQDSFV